MSENKNCPSCPQHNDCKSMYQQLGSAEGSCVAVRSIAAFVVPIIIFALSSAVFDKLLEAKIANSDSRTLTSAFISLLICLIYAMSYKLLSSRFSNRKNRTCAGIDPDDQGSKFNMKEKKNRN